MGKEGVSYLMGKEGGTYLKRKERGTYLMGKQGGTYLMLEEGGTHLRQFFGGRVFDEGVSVNLKSNLLFSCTELIDGDGLSVPVDRAAYMTK